MVPSAQGLCQGSCPQKELRAGRHCEVGPDVHRADKERKQGPVTDPKPLVTSMFPYPLCQEGGLNSGGEWFSDSLSAGCGWVPLPTSADGSSLGPG